jgi:hypothetical protein
VGAEIGGNLIWDRRKQANFWAPETWPISCLAAGTMSTRLFAFIPLALLIASACGDAGDAAPEISADAAPASVDAASADHRVYEHALYDDPDDCPDDPLFNCAPSMSLCADGSATILVTDIMNAGSYAETDDAITTTWEAGDVPSEIEFAIADDGSTLEDDWQGWTWTLVEDGDPICPN